jgi:hypothetical protein
MEAILPHREWGKAGDPRSGTMGRGLAKTSATAGSDQPTLMLRCPSLLSLVKLLAAMGISWQHFGRALACSERSRPPRGPETELVRSAND